MNTNETIKWLEQRSAEYKLFNIPLSDKFLKIANEMRELQTLVDGADVVISELQSRLSTQRVESNEKLCDVLNHMTKLLERLPAMGGGAYTCNCRCNYRPTGGYGGGQARNGGGCGSTSGGGGSGTDGTIEIELGK